MKLVSFSVENFRSITAARKIPLTDYSLLIGANNEGKSNILHALSLAMNALIQAHWKDKPVRYKQARRGAYYWGLDYEWSRDFPITKQKRINDNSLTKITLEFQLDDTEIKIFKKQIKSNLNGTLPIAISFNREMFSFSVQKPGKGSTTLNRKSQQIASFISQRIRFEYIPAIRTSKSAGQVINKLLDKELLSLEENPKYIEALNKIEELQKPIFDELAETIQKTISRFLPNVKDVRLESSREARNTALRREVAILVNDGQETNLDRKGDGIQSLATLALMRHASEQSHSHSSTVIAIEEPECHLHPRAIHEVRSVIEELSEKNQIILSSHSPLFVDASDVKNTILVKESKATSARNISEIREALGVRLSDNLVHAQIVVLVEGESDKNALGAILPVYSEKIGSALQKGSIMIDHLSGASKLTYKASFYKSLACNILCLLDHDAEGKLAAEKAKDALTVKDSEIIFCSVPGLLESELEDLYDTNEYDHSFFDEFQTSLKTRPKSEKNSKWSKRLEVTFKMAGKSFSNDKKAQIKKWIADFVTRNPEKIINSNFDGPIKSLVSSLESKIK